MDSGDAPALHRAATLLNRSINEGDRQAAGLPVRRARQHVPRTTPRATTAAADWINGIVPSDKQESFHPNEAGHRAIAAHLRQAAPGYFR